MLRSVIGRGMPALETTVSPADTAGVSIRLLRRLRTNDGFGLVELLVALLVLNIGLLALLAAFVNGSTAIRRAGRIATASTLLDTQMELYRALTYGAIALDPSSIPATSPYTTDSAYNASQVTATCSGAVSSNPQCNASQTVTGPDRVSYRIDTYIVYSTPSSGRQLKHVTVVARDPSNVSSRPLARLSTSFDQATGS
jgi:Tfp pilus assembly protein PilV